ncbi:glial cell line-derived neurotrophic factor [Colossoma macropomum]|uniref:glial cell line-derived neurotrophic factor n=1 Tax=Colossoma macropomum TaxID=42526 RepID=UPI0018643500|nr:glial cell line-derived neurotrophic factor [Colossoma macropomum]
MVSGSAESDLDCVSKTDSLSSLRAELKLQRSPAPRGSAGRGRCGLRQVQVKVSELGLGYLSQEELVFRYCSGPCLNSITNYDRILTRLATGRRSILQGAPPTACCRPTAYERHLAFLGDDLLYHILRKHSARRCGCV